MRAVTAINAAPDLPLARETALVEAWPRTFDATLAMIEKRFIGSHQSMAIGRGPVMADIVSRRSSSSHQRLLWWPWIVTAFARLEGRIALDEVLSRFPEWEIDWEHAQQAHTSTVRGWEKLPVVTR